MSNVFVFVCLLNKKGLNNSYREQIKIKGKNVTVTRRIMCLWLSLVLVVHLLDNQGVFFCFSCFSYVTCT